jgi:hypothetical protein
LIGDAIGFERVARAAGRLAATELAEPLYPLLERDLTDYAAARAARLNARGRGAPDAMGYTRMYANAFAAMHDAPAVAVLIRGLGDLRWGTDAAAALLEPIQRIGDAGDDAGAHHVHRLIAALRDRLGRSDDIRKADRPAFGEGAIA